MATSSSKFDGFRLAVLLEGALAIAAVLLAWLFGVELRRLFPASLEESIGAIGRGIIATIPMLVCFWFLVCSSQRELVRLREQVERIVGEIFPDAHLGQFALVALLAGFGEELLFRGVLQVWLANWTNPLFALFFASLLFGAAHALSLTYFLFATLIGAYFGWLMLQYNDLVAPIVAHALYDFIALVYIARLRPAPPESTPELRPDESSESHTSD